MIFKLDMRSQNLNEEDEDATITHNYKITAVACVPV